MYELPEPYEATRQKLLERDRVAFKHWDPPATERDITRNKCTWWAKAFGEAHPELTLVRGFFGIYNPENPCTEYAIIEHVWFTTADGTIIDPTRAQFGAAEQGCSDLYRVFDPLKDEIYLGKCPNCGEPQYGLEAEGPKDICSEECAASYESYIRKEARGW